MQVLWLPTYREIRQLLRVWSGRSKALVVGLHRTLRQLSGSPGKPNDWKDPDTWIQERLSDENRELAHRIWADTSKTVNPRYTRHAWSAGQNYALLAENSDGILELTDRGREFIEHEFGETEALLDRREGLIELLAIVSDNGPAPLGTFFDTWAAYLKQHSRDLADSSIRETLRDRLENLLDRKLIDSEGRIYTITEAGLDYLRRVGAATGTEHGGFKALTKSLQEADLLFSRELVANYILALQTKRFAILTGISGTGKTKIAMAVARHFRPVLQTAVDKNPDDAVDKPLDNRVVVPVRPDWVDNRGLLGYLNPLTNEYSTTPFLNLVLRARDEERRAEAAGEKPHPFFVILDEMNLARVEHYFSDFLSALESGEAIPLHEDEAVESGESESGPRVPRKLRVPGNVLFTGTVNVDETTYMFSPKVLDRAFTIEFDRVDLKGFADGASSDDTSGLNLDGVQGSLDLLHSGRLEGNDWKPSRDDWMEFSEETGGHQEALLRLHGILETRHRHFGYRVANEIARFVNLARGQAKDAAAAVNAAFDLALLQKVLPKFHGTQQELESLLEEVFQFAAYGGGHVAKKDQEVKLDDWKVVKGRLVSKSPPDDAAAKADESDSDNQQATDPGTKSPAYPRTGGKVLRMLNRLRDRGFTSFIE